MDRQKSKHTISTTSPAVQTALDGSLSQIDAQATQPTVTPEVDRRKQYTCFVAMPFESPAKKAKKTRNGDDWTEDNPVFQALVRSCQELSQADIGLRLDRADYSLKDLRLWDNIRLKIESCDFVIADISRGNPNVLYELGYARALGKKAIHITRTPDEKLADLQGWLYIPYELATLDKLTTTVARCVSDITAVVDAKVQLEAFRVDGYRHRIAANMANLIDHARENIDIYTTNVADILNSPFLDGLTNALKRYPQLRIRVLTMDPESDLIPRRARQLNFDTYTYRTELRENIRRIYAQGRPYSDRFLVRLYDDLPTQMTFRFDSKVVTAVVSTITRSRSNIHFVLDTKQAGVTESFIYHFEVVWGRAYPVPPEMLTQLPFSSQRSMTVRSRTETSKQREL